VQSVSKPSISKEKSIYYNRFKRLKFIGEPRNFQEIMKILANLENFPLKSKQRLIAIEELCIYVNVPFII